MPYLFTVYILFIFYAVNFWITTENQRDNSYGNKISSYWNFSVTSVKCTASKTVLAITFFSPSPHTQFIMLIIFL